MYFIETTHFMAFLMLTGSNIVSTKILKNFILWHFNTEKILYYLKKTAYDNYIDKD